MPQPTPYARAFSFTDFQATAPSVPMPGYRVDAEFDHVGATLDGILTNIAMIQRDDGKLATGAVTVDSVAPELLTAIAAAAPPGPPGNPGVPGAPGNPGANAPNPNFTFTATSLAPGAVPTVALSGAYPNLTVALGLPKGDPAPAGAAVIANGVYGDVTVSGGGTVYTVTKVGGAVPSFPGHTHVIADVTGLQGALDTLTTGQAGKLDKAAPIVTGTSIFVNTNKAVFQHDGTTGFLRSAVGELWIGGANATQIKLSATSITLLQPVSAQAINATILQRNGIDVSLVGHTHVIADVTGLQAALNAKQPTGDYATNASLATKAPAVTPVVGFAVDTLAGDANNNQYLRFTGGTPRTFTFGNAPAAGTAFIVANRSTANLTLVCAGGYYKNGAVVATANLTLAPGGKVSAFHEGAGVWTLDGAGF